MSYRLLLPLLIALTISLNAAPPVWEAGSVEGDPLFFVQKEGQAHASARLLRTPAQPPVIRSATLETTYEAGRDFTWEPGSRRIVLTQGSRIPSHTIAQLHPAPNTPHSYRACRDGKSWMLFGEGRFFHDLQCAASYPCGKPDWTAPLPAPAPDDQLASLRKKLKAGGPLKLVTLGDSISTGANASGAVDAPPHQPGYPGLVARGLAEYPGVKVTEKNLSVGGMDAVWGTQQIPAVIAEAPDLLLCAFGMNDASGGRKPEEFATLIRRIRDEVRAALPYCDVIVISPMTANSEWIHSAPDLYPAYATALRTLTGPGCALADVTPVWTAFAAEKDYLSLSGNGLNHPNDFGHRLYADVILTTIGRATPEKAPR